MICKNCGKEFTEKYSKWSNGDFCSRFCARSYSQKQFDDTKTKKVTCITCGKEIEVKIRTSSKQCKCNDCKKRKDKKIKKEKQFKYCLNCHKIISDNTKTCFCQICFSRNKTYKNYENYINSWKNNLENGLKGKTGISNHIRKYLFEKYNNKCSKCGWNEINQFTKKIPLTVEHIDGNYKNNNEENLDLLCPNCHSLTSTYGSLNIGHGRPFSVRR